MNVFGDVRAENDRSMLDSSFHEWQDYRSLFENSDRFIVVGRRGTGKSALTYRLSSDWHARRQPSIVIAPSEEQVFGLRPLAAALGDSLTRIRAGVKIVCRYGLLLEIGIHLHDYYKSQNDVQSNPVLFDHVRKWRALGGTPIERMRQTLRRVTAGMTDPLERISDMPQMLDVIRITNDIVDLVKKHDRHFLLLIDRLDEGYEPDTTGIGIVDGIIYGVDEVRSALGSKFKAVVFLRDNIFRAIQSADNDFSRNLESQVLRLHWDSQELFYFVSKRIRTFLGSTQESDVKVWNAITTGELQGREGFKRCLKLTLYRPRDVIALLNTAYYQAKRQGRSVLIEGDINHSSKHISTTRYHDLGKEYEYVFPGITVLTQAFVNGHSKMTVEQAGIEIDKVFGRSDLEAAASQHFKILGNPIEAIKSLYGVGFFGIFNSEHGNFVFSHDGKKPEKTITADSALMIHPCYWIALNLQQQDIDGEVAEDIFDEYEITISSQSAEQRTHLLGKLISEVGRIPLGAEGDSDFEDWCKRAIEIAFAKQLANVQLKPNRQAALRRDIVATNQGLSGFWKRILTDYSTRLVVFEVKNYEKVSADEYRQVSGYLDKEYGRFGFLICRDAQAGLVKGGELEAFREFYSQNKVVLKLTVSTLINILSKLRSPEKLDVPNLVLGKSLDTHIALYANGQTENLTGSRNKKGRRRDR